MRFVNIQSASSITLANGTVISKCDECRTTWKERNERGVAGGPICEAGEFCAAYPVELLQQNHITAQIYQRIKGQVIFYFNGEVSKEYDLNHIALWNMIDHWPEHISNKFEIFDLVLHCYHTFLRERQDDGI